MSDRYSTSPRPWYGDGELRALARARALRAAHTGQQPQAEENTR